MTSTNIQLSPPSSYWDWVPSRQTLKRATIAVATSAVAWDIAYSLVTSTSDNVIQTVANRGIQSLGAMMSLGVAAHLYQEQVKEKPNEVPEMPLAKPTHQIIHIPQRHWSPEAEYDPSIVSAIWESQFRVLKLLQSYPNAAVFVEGVHQTVHHYDYNGPFRKTAHMIFLNGLPEKMEDWTKQQRRFLATEGAAGTLYFLGIIDTLYQASDRAMENLIALEIEDADALIEDADALEDYCEELLKTRIYGERENFLAKKVREFLRKPENKDRQVLIVYGAAHELSDHFPTESFLRLTNELSAAEIDPCQQNEHKPR